MSDNTSELAKELYQIKKLTLLGFLQAKAAVDDSETQINQLTDHFTQLFDIEQKLSENLILDSDNTLLMERLRYLIGSIVVEFQFFDRLKQKIEQSVEPLRQWSEDGIIVDPDSPDFVNRYSTKEERNLYHALQTQGSIEKALSYVALMEVDDDDDIEMF